MNDCHLGRKFDQNRHDSRDCGSLLVSGSASEGRPTRLVFIFLDLLLSKVVCLSRQCNL